MKRTRVPRSFLYTILVSILLFIAIAVLMNRVQELLQSDVQINLTEIVTQNKDVINSKIELEVNNLDLVARQVVDRISMSENPDQVNVRELFLKYAEEAGDPFLCYSDPEGNALYGDGQEVSIAGRRYFQLAMQGKENISERTISRLNGQDIFVISVPLRYNGEIIGTLQKQYTPDEMYNICSISLFSQQGSMCIINSEGYILISSEHGETYSKESSNYYRMLYLENPTAAKRLEQDLLDGKEGFMEVTIAGEKQFSAYANIEKIHDWYLITSINANAVMPNASIVIKLFFGILSVVVVSLATMMMYHLSLKNKQRMRIEQLAFVDEVTGGNTYTKFTIDVQKLLQTEQRTSYSILAFDIDSFKYINGFYGFEQGDKILKTVYDQYQSQLTEKERIARISADHFVVLLKDVSTERLKTLFCSELSIDGIKVYLSAGLYHLKNNEESLNLVLDKATLISRKAKDQSHKEVFIYSDEVDADINRKEQVKRAIEQALANNEIVAYFQPKVDIDGNKLAAAEALARWITKEGVMISPAEFIPICEKTGIITSIDWTILEQTLQFLRTCIDNHLPCVPISVNFSRHHLRNPDFSQTLRERLEHYQIPGELIEVELTETIIFDNAKSVNNLIHELHDFGVKVSMDDFGSGYSSLHMLQDVDIDTLKIDRGFLQSTENSERQTTIFETIVQMANKLHIQTVVEGVETAEHITLMKQSGASIAQGYFYSKPVDRATFEKLCEGEDLW